MSLVSRRGLLQSLAAAAVGTALIEPVESKEQEIEPMDFAPPYLARVWLDGVEFQNVVSMRASTYPGEEVKGSITYCPTNSNGCVIPNGTEIYKVTNTGMVRWELID